MSYRLITKATLTLANNESTVDVRAYASPKGASVGTLSLNGEIVPFKLTGGQGRGSVVRCYAYFPYGTESAYIEISRDQMTELKSGNHATIFTLTSMEVHARNDQVQAGMEPTFTASPEAPEAPESVEQTEAPKAKRIRRARAAA